MRYYFILQLTRLQRWLRELGVHPLIGVLLGLIFFGFLSAYFFSQTEYAHWLYALFAGYTVSSLGDRGRTRLLKALFTKVDYLKVRLIENLVVAFPFAGYLLYEAQFELALLVGGVALLLAFFSQFASVSTVIPTPFGKTPFENIIGFRKSFFFVGIIYFVLFKAVQVGNYSLGVVTLGVLFFLLMSFQAKPEPSYFVRIFSCDEKAFLKQKMWFAARSALILAVPILLVLGVFFPARLLITFAVFLVGQLFLLSMVLAKYSAYPNELSLPQAILYGLSLWFPPMLLVVCVLFYKKSKQNLKAILG